MEDAGRSQQSAQDPQGFQVKGGPAGTFWEARNNAAGRYTLKASAGQLEGAGQTYAYFVVAQDGSYLIRHRSGDSVKDVARASHDAVKRPDGSGRSSNTLEVRVSPQGVSYVVNGTVVHSAPKATFATDGVVGFRVNHQLDVAVEGFELRRS